ncbi:hypothetical protein JZ751_000750 [Albula glossodonta]|uniref:Uncharacterized protein n=1 Tax=Albula glossodonta TaxID=121402 RepID=A0A8T2PXG3_9TELE|nr:hypothetical protein JZ751_000750 [Albula glossodonta]
MQFASLPLGGDTSHSRGSLASVADLTPAMPTAVHLIVNDGRCGDEGVGGWGLYAVPDCRARCSDHADYRADCNAASPHLPSSPLPPTLTAKAAAHLGTTADVVLKLGLEILP